MERRKQSRPVESRCGEQAAVCAATVGAQAVDGAEKGCSVTGAADAVKGAPQSAVNTTARTATAGAQVANGAKKGCSVTNAADAAKGAAQRAVTTTARAAKSEAQTVKSAAKSAVNVAETAVQDVTGSVAEHRKTPETAQNTAKQSATTNREAPTVREAPTGEAAHTIEVDGLTKDYGFGRGVFDVSLHVDRGEVFGFLGPNGAGKSTTIRHLMGFSRPDAGHTRLFGQETFDRYDRVLRRVGYIPGEIALPAGLTGWEFIRMMQQLQGVKNEERLTAMRELFELEDTVLRGETKRMSLGVKRKLAVVTAFMSDPEVLILDEPTSGLDPVMQECFIQFIHEEKARGKTILLSSHIFSEIDSTCDRIAIIKDGRIVSEFVADDLKHASRKFYTVVFESDGEAAAFGERSRAIASCTVLSSANAQVDLSVEDRDLNELIALLSSMAIRSFSNRKETLEDYFMKFYKEDKSFGGAL